MKEATQNKEPLRTHEAGAIFQATVGYHNYGFYTTESEALAVIRDSCPDAKPFEGTPHNPGEVPDGQYYIQLRTLYTLDSGKAEKIKGALKK